MEQNKENLPEKSNLLPGGLGSVRMGDVEREITQVYAKHDGSVTITIGPPEPPKDWELMTPEEQAEEQAFFNEIMYEADREQRRDDMLMGKNYNAMMNCIKYLKGERFALDLKEYMEECEASGSDFGFVSEPQGECQEEEEYEFKEAWVDQHVSYPCEDCYYGWIYIQVGENRYIKFHYAC